MTLAVFGRLVLPLLLMMLCGAGVSANSGETKTQQIDSLASASLNADIFQLNRLIGRGINVSGLEQPDSGAWGYSLQAESFSTIAQAGFDSVRIPIRWSNHAAPIGADRNGVYQIDDAFFRRVDDVVSAALAEGLRVIINVHHYLELYDSPSLHSDRFLSLWEQIATRYAGLGNTVYFELLNEPTDTFAERPDLWNELLARTLQVIRLTNPERAVLIGPVSWNLIENLRFLTLPDDDHLIVSVHYYDRSEFTHQGATWVEPVFPTGVEWRSDTLRLGSGLQDWSWDTTVSFESDAVELKFQRTWAAFTIADQIMLPQSLSIDVKGEASLVILCSDGGDFVSADTGIRHESDYWTTYTVSLSKCPKQTTQIALQNDTEGAVTVSVRGGKICDSTGCKALFLSELNAIGQAFDVAADWGRKHHRPMHLGEFGVFDAADLASRVRWTAAVQEAAHVRGMSSSYWEFDQGFGVWEQSEGGWIDELLEALLPDTGGQ